jgi:hypothetical protein
MNEIKDQDSIYNNTKQKHDEAYQSFTFLESETTALKRNW